MSFSVTGLRKSYGAAEVLAGIDLDVRDGEIHALLGANGAGKSTLIKCLSGAVSPSAGEIVIDDTTYPALRPQDARDAGIAVIHQELSTALTLDVCDNIFLGNELRRGPFVRRRAQVAQARRWLSNLGVDISPDADLGDLGNAELQTIEIVKALRTDPRLLILDEPTAALSEHEAELLGDHLRKLKAQDIPMLYVTHRLSEVFALADRVSVLRGGRIVLSGPIGDVTHDQVVDAIVGMSVARNRSAAPLVERRDMLRVEGLAGPKLGPISFTAARGEILGIFGLVGSGRTELLETLFGAAPAVRGEVFLDGAASTPRSSVEAAANGIALVPSDRLRKSILADMSAADNMLFATMRSLGAWGVRRRSREAQSFAREADRLNLQPRDPHLEARRFSGGNQQKLAVARWLNADRDLRLMMLDEPTQGVDIGARSEIYAALRALSRTGEAVLLVTSSEPEELVQIAHRVIVLADGRIAGILEGDAITDTALTALAHAGEGLSGAAPSQPTVPPPETTGSPTEIAHV